MQKIQFRVVAGFIVAFLLLVFSACRTWLPEAAPQTPQSAVCPQTPDCPACPAISAAGAKELPTAPPVDAAPHLEAARWADLPGWQEDTLAAAWDAFLASCQGMTEKPPESAWRQVCAQARGVRGQREHWVRRFFESAFIPYAVIESDGRAEGLVTGYYEPLVRGSRQPDAHNRVPVWGVPSDMLSIELGALYPEIAHLRLRGRIENGKVVPYWSRAEIEAGFSPQSATQKPLLWVADAVEFFFLQTQGSGRVELPDGTHVRIGYADQNGHPYRSIGRALIERGELKPSETSMQSIQAWARRHPDELRALLDVNPSYVFFRELPGADAARGPIGALGVPLTAERSIAVDARYIPLGAPVWLATTYPNSKTPLNRLMLAQDTGGAIKGGVRADFFWGFGRAAGQQAGRMKQSGRMWVLLPRQEKANP
ncbi:MAG: MltA domain-containing protein [Zoogloeaceae bacterium]|jgi:membrane-bound lytic murein transglycosylase A|nr:MltA domain-containing protein [Zoogloeaceae bacterium]